MIGHDASNSRPGVIHRPEGAGGERRAAAGRPLMLTLKAGLLSLLLLFTGLFATDVVAANRSYTIPADLSGRPFQCSHMGGGVYRCNRGIDFGNDRVTLNVTSNTTLRIEGDFKAKNRLTINSVGGVLTLDVEDDIEIENTLTGTVNLIAGGDIKLKNTVNMTGDISSGGDIEIKNNATITGDITADDDIKIGNNADITGDITAGDDLEIGSGSVVDGTCIPDHPLCNGGGETGGLILSWSMEEEASPIADDSGNGYSGHFSGDLLTQLEDPPGVAYTDPGDRGLSTCRYARFDGHNDYLVNSSVASELNGLSAITIMLWVNNDAATPADRDLVSTNTARSDEYLNFRYDQRGASSGGTALIKASVRTNRGFQQVETVSNIQSSGWQHIAYTWESGEDITIYINGSPVSNAWKHRAVRGNINNVNTFRIGDDFWGGDWLGQIDEVRVYGYRADQARIQQEMQATRPCVIENLDHYAIDHPGSGITCQAMPVTVTAHDAEHNAVEPGASTTITLLTDSPNSVWSSHAGNAGSFTASRHYTFAAGETQATFWLSHATPVTGLGIDILDNQGRRENQGDPVEDPSASFSDTGFVFVSDTASGLIETRIAGVSAAEALYLQAVEKDTDTAECVAALEGMTAVELAYECRNPSSCHPLDLMQINAQSIRRNNGDSVASYTPVSLSFDSQGRAPIDLLYHDVGLVKLHARVTLPADLNTDPPTSAVTLEGSSNAFVVQPHHFVLEEMVCSDGTLNPVASGPLGDPFCRAGEDFRIQTYAATGTGAVAYSYGRELPPESVGLVHSRLLPDPGADGDFAGQFSAFGSNCSGAAAAGYACGSEFNWNEVGIITLEPRVLDGSYLNSGNVIGNPSGSLGRFYPARLDVSDNGPFFANSCSGLFTYFGQEFGFALLPELTITGVSQGGATTDNYDSPFWRFDSTLASRGYQKDAALATTASLTPPTASGGVSISDVNDQDGQRVYTITGDRFTATKGTTPEDPITAVTPLVDLSLPAGDLSDRDGACYDPDLDGSCDAYQIGDISGTELRYGKAFAEDVHGTMGYRGDALIMPVGTYYWMSSAGGWQPNAEDSCTGYSYTDSGTASVTITSGSPGTLSHGVDELTLRLISNGPDTQRDVAIDWPVWLQDTTSNAHFGIYRGDDRFIYWRELE